MIIPTRAASHIQNTAPGPPVAMAVATPPMFPTPMVVPRAMLMASAEERIPAPRRSSPRPRTLFQACLMAVPNPVNWKNPVRRVR